MSAPGHKWEKDMRTRNHNCRSVVFRETRDKHATGLSAPVLFALLIGTAAQADPIQDAEIAQEANTVAQR